MGAAGVAGSSDSVVTDVENASTAGGANVLLREFREDNDRKWPFDAI